MSATELVHWCAEPFTFGFMRRALLVATVLSVSGALVGSVLVLRRLALLGDALSHAVLPGLAVAWWLFGRGPLALIAGALGAGLLTAGASLTVNRLTRLKEDAAFGAFFLVAYAGGIALLSAHGPRGDLLHFLFGQVLTVTTGDAVFAAAVAGVTLAGFVAGRRALVLELFDPTFARATGGRGALVHAAVLVAATFNLVAALQTMGAVLALGLFLLPAATAYLWCDRLARLVLFAAALGTAGSAGGLWLSFRTGLPGGPAIVLVLGAAFLASALGSPRYGVARALRDQWRSRRAVRPGAP